MAAHPVVRLAWSRALKDRRRMRKQALCRVCGDEFSPTEHGMKRHIRKAHFWTGPRLVVFGEESNADTGPGGMPPRPGPLLVTGGGS